MKILVILVTFLLLTFFSIKVNSQVFNFRNSISPKINPKGIIYHAADSYSCDSSCILTQDGKGNYYLEYKKPDTCIISLKIFDEDGYLKRIKVYKVVYSKKLVMVSNEYYLTQQWEDSKIEYFYMNKVKIKEEDIDK